MRKYYTRACNFYHGSEARRLIRGGGAKLNNETIKDENLIIDQSSFLNNDTIKLSAGKKRHINIKLK